MPCTELVGLALGAGLVAGEKWAELEADPTWLQQKRWILECSKAGDLIFFGRVPDKAGEFESAVLSSGRNGRGLFHVGVIVTGETEGSGGGLKQPMVVHATQKGVMVQTLTEALLEVEPDEIQVYGVEVSDAEKAAAERFCLSKVGCTYNDIFSKECVDSQGNEAYYCSQLVTEAYKNADVGFPPHKMSFAQEEGGVLPYWEDYFKQRGCSVPVGEDGSHPSKLVEAARLQMRMSVRVAAKFAAFRDPARLHKLHWIGGSAVALNGGQQFAVVEPRSGLVVTQCASATPTQTETALKVARAAQPAWADKSWLERGEVLRKTAQLIRDHLEDISKAECKDNGKPIYEARMDVASCAETFDFYAGTGVNLAGGHYPLDSSRFAYTRREPVGVVGCVGPSSSVTPTVPPGCNNPTTTVKTPRPTTSPSNSNTRRYSTLTPTASLLLSTGESKPGSARFSTAAFACAMRLIKF